MPPPQYKPRSHYHTRRSAGEPSANPGADFGATSLDRPMIHVAALVPRRVAASAGKTGARPKARRPAQWIAGSAAWLRMTALMVVVACALAGSMMGALLALLGV